MFLAKMLLLMKYLVSNGSVTVPRHGTGHNHFHTLSLNVTRLVFKTVIFLIHSLCYICLTS